MNRRLAFVLLAMSAFAPVSAFAQVKVGITISMTGPGASLGVPQRNTVALLPKEIGGQAVSWIMLDDATDSTKAVANARKMIDEDNVDAIIGSRRHAGLDGADRRRGGEEDPGDLAVGECPDHRADGCDAALGVQDAAE